MSAARESTRSRRFPYIEEILGRVNHSFRCLVRSVLAQPACCESSVRVDESNRSLILGFEPKEAFIGSLGCVSRRNFHPLASAFIPDCYPVLTVTTFSFAFISDGDSILFVTPASSAFIPIAR